MLQLSAHVVEIRGLAPAFKAWQLLTGVEVNSKFRFNASMDAEAFLLWWPGGLPIEWAPSTGKPCTNSSPLTCAAPCKRNIKTQQCRSCKQSNKLHSEFCFCMIQYL